MKKTEYTFASTTIKFLDSTNVNTAWLKEILKQRLFFLRFICVTMILHSIIMLVDDNFCSAQRDSWICSEAPLWASNLSAVFALLVGIFVLSKPEIWEPRGK